MNILTPPTDSFYKFAAIGGLILFLAGAFFIFKEGDHEDELLTKQQGEERILQKEINLLSDELKYNLKYKKLNDSIDNGIGKLLDESNPIVSKDSLYKDSLRKVILYNLPDSIQNRYKTIILKSEQLKINRDLITKHKENHDSYFIPYLIALYLGEIACLAGFILWYSNIQKPLDEEQKLKEGQRQLQGEYWSENCQSCLKTFLFVQERGKELNGNPSKLFCKECYTEGAFIEPELTFNQAEAKLRTELNRLNYKERKIRKKIIILKKSLRWKRNDLW